MSTNGHMDLLEQRWQRVAFDEHGQPRAYRIDEGDLDLRTASKADLRNAIEQLGGSLSQRATINDAIVAYVRLSGVDAVGTAEAAALLGVERPRIGRWLGKGEMPMPCVWLASGPVWYLSEIDAMVEEVASRRRQTTAV